MNVAQAYQEFENSPCYKCDMLSSMHAHTGEEAENFQFGCSGEKFEACCRLRQLRLCGAPGATGMPGFNSSFNDKRSKKERARIDMYDEKRNRAYWEEIARCEAILAGTDKTIW